MSDVFFISPTELYNLLNQSFLFSNLSDPNYLLLFDAREKEDFEESHILTARRLKRSKGGEPCLPFDSELQSKEFVIVYDNSTVTLDSGDSHAVGAASFLTKVGSRNPVRILKGGYEEFSALYPFLRTQKILYMPREMDELKPYPLEVIPGFLYIGSRQQASAAYIRKDLKIKAHVNCTTAEDPYYKEGDAELFAVPVDDSVNSVISLYFSQLCAFIENKFSMNHRVLIYSDLGIGRCVALALAYLIQTNRWKLEEALEHVANCCHRMCPNSSFLTQLRNFETGQAVVA